MFLNKQIKQIKKRVSPEACLIDLTNRKKRKNSYMWKWKNKGKKREITFSFSSLKHILSHFSMLLSSLVSLSFKNSWIKLNIKHPINTINQTERKLWRKKTTGDDSVWFRGDGSWWLSVNQQQLLMATQRRMAACRFGTTMKCFGESVAVPSSFSFFFVLYFDFFYFFGCCYCVVLIIGYDWWVWWFGCSLVVYMRKKCILSIVYGSYISE